MFQPKNGTKPVDLYKKEWFIIIENRQEGPYSLLDLKRDHRFTPDTLVWKKGFQEWIPARFVLEMGYIFKDEPQSKALHEPKRGKRLADLGKQDQVTLTMHQDPYQLLLWILVLLLILLYTFYQFF
jgi:GYF domain 2